MTENGNNEDPSSNNVLRITDELVRQVDRTKKLVAIMLLAVIVAIPVSWHLAPLLTSTPNSFRIAGYVAIAVAIVFVGIGVRQWLELSKWTRKYRAYKKLQKKVDSELDFDLQPGQ